MSGFKHFIHLLEVDHPKGLSHTEVFLSNADLRPVPPKNRTWRAWNFVALYAFTLTTTTLTTYNSQFTSWIADSYNLNTWMIVSSMVGLGLSWWQAWICVWLGYGCISPFIVLNARPGAVHHITFPVVARTSFGIWGSLWCTLNRGVMACVWYGVQAWIGGNCMTQMLRAMWPSFWTLKNTMPESSGTNTRDFVGFFLFWLISLPAIWFPLHKIRHLFTAKAIVVPIAGFTFFIWVIVKAKGVGPIIHQPGTLQGSNLGWAMVVSLMSCISNMATLTVNAPDFASRATNPSAAALPQLIAMPLGFIVVSFMGIIVSSSSTVIYGESIWNPIDLLGKFLDNDANGNGPSSATRFGVWFISAAFILAQLGTNISANSISAGCDLTSLMPRFINIRRGGFIAAIIGLAMCPWNLLKDGATFTSYLSAYSVFLSSIAGVMITEYFLIHKGHYRVADLYDPSKKSWYHYFYGINPRAYGAYIAGILINVVGFAGATGQTVPLEATRIYQMSFFTGFGVSSIVYYVLNRIWPSPGAFQDFKEIDESEFELREAEGEEGEYPSDSDTKDKLQTEGKAEVVAGSV